MEERKKETQGRVFEIIAAIVLAALAIGCFITQLLTLNAQTSKTETALFNLLEFLLTVGFSWFGSRAVSRSLFEKELKRFAISAYRRISDIHKMINRLNLEIVDMMSRKSMIKQHELKFINAIVADTCQIVKSSTDDWIDIIGDELFALEKIKQLEREKRNLELSPLLVEEGGQTKSILKDLENKIVELRSSLPALLRAKTEELNENQRVRYDSKKAAAWYADRHIRNNGLLLKVVAGEGYSSGHSLPILTSEQPLHVSIGNDGGLDVVDSEGKIVGRVLNDSPFDYDEFVAIIEICYGNLDLSVRFIKTLSNFKSGTKDLINYSIKILTKPIINPADYRYSKKKKAS
jgi:uncharacterized membrane protein YciS (DUF1049 family)